MLIAASDSTPAETTAADVVCDGTNDQKVIHTAFFAGTPAVLSPGTFRVSSPVRLRSHVTLTGAGRFASELHATEGFPPGRGVVELSGPNVEGTTLADVAVHGNRDRADTHGIRYDNTGGTFGFADPAHTIDRVYVHRPRRHGVELVGCRATTAGSVRVIDAGGDGFRVDSPDCFFSRCEAGSCSGYGWNITEGNSRFTCCKAWYSDRSGWRVAHVRNQLAACESQDNAEHGFLVEQGLNSLAACHADSNSWQRGNSARGRFNGFHITQGAAVSLSGCAGYDKNESGRGPAQGWAVWVGPGVRSSLIDVVGQGNVHGVAGGTFHSSVQLRVAG